MATDRTRIGEKARKDPGLVFTSLYHHICDVDNLRACYDDRAKRILFKWLNRKSQRKSYTWESFTQALAWVVAACDEAFTESLVHAFDFHEHSEAPVYSKVLVLLS